MNVAKMQDSHDERLKELPLPPKGQTGWPWTPDDPTTQRPAIPEDRLPSISLITPSFNQGPFIEETIRSVLLQGYPKLQYLIVDGGSRDGTVEVIRKYAPWLDYWISEPDRGQSHAINKGMMRATGQLANWLNSDDILAPGALWTVAEHFDATQPDDVLVGHGVIVDDKGRVVFAPQQVELSFEVLLDWMSHSNFMQPSCFFPRTVAASIGFVDESLRYCMDVDLWLRLAKRCRFRRIPDCLSFSKSHPDTKTNAERYLMHAEGMELIARNGGWAVLRKELNRWASELTEIQASGRRLGPLFRIARRIERKSRQRLRKTPSA